MAEKIFNEQTNYGWGLTFNLTGKAPAISKRIFDTLEDATLFANDYNDSAIEGLLLSVVNDEVEKNNGVYFVQRIKKSAVDDDAILVKVGSGDIEDIAAAFNEQFEELKKADTNLTNAIKATNDSITNTIGVVTDDKTVVEMIADVEAVSAQNAQDIIDNKNIIDEYTINEKKISENPVLDSNDILLNEEYTTLTQPAENVIPGDLVTTAISKLEVMLANTTLALTAAINDLEMKIGSPSSYDENGNITAQATGLYAKYEELMQENNLIFSENEYITAAALTDLNDRVEDIELTVNDETNQ